jgi:tetratricopeptide (TPR) repeat protein
MTNSVFIVKDFMSTFAVFHKIKMAFLICIWVVLGFANTESFEDKYQKAMQLWRNGQDQQAISDLQSLVKINPDSTVLYSMLGQMEFQQGNVTKARDWFKEAEKRSSDDLTVYYYLALCYRETGKHKALLMRKNDWNKSESYFEFVVKKYPAYQQVFYQWAVLERYRGHYDKAVELAERQLAITPGNPKSHLGLHTMLDLFLEYSDPLEWFEKREDRWSEYFKAEFLRRQGDFAAAEKSLHALIYQPDSTFSIIPVYLSLAQVYAQNGKASQINHIWEQILSNLRTSVDVAFLFDDMKYIFTDKELDAFSRLYNLKNIRHFFDRFWKRRNPIPAAPENMRLAEHFKRVAIAEEKYRYDGFRLWFNNPDKLQYLHFPQSFWLNDKFNDKGLVYIRHGEPHERAMDVIPGMPTNESWLYYANGSLPKLMFHFLIDENAVGNNWRLTAQLPRALMSSRLTWDHIFQRIYTGTPLEVIQYKNELAEKSKQDVWIGLDTDRHTWQEEIKPLEIPFYVAGFQDSLQIRREFYYGLPVSTWQQDSIKVVEFALVVQDTLLNTVFKQRFDFDIQRLVKRINENGFWIDQIDFIGSEEIYRYNVYVRAKNTSKMEGYSFFHQSFLDRELYLSDIELASDILEKPLKSVFDKESLTVIPNPRRIVEQGVPFFVYFEIYNILPENRQSVDFTLEYRFRLLKSHQTNIFSKIWRWIAGSEEQTFAKIDRKSDKPVSKEYMAFDLGDRKTGEYELSIRAQIANSHKKAEKSIKFELR